MSLEETIQAFKDHIGSLLDEPVSLEWPIDEKKAIHIFVYSVSDDDFNIRSSKNENHTRVIRALVFANPENEYSVFDRVMLELQRHPIFEAKGTKNSVTPDSVTVQEIAQIFVARKQPYRLSMAYEIKCIESKDL